MRSRASPSADLSVIYPQLFFKALNFAGGICAVILFGLLPVAMVWIGRYRKETAASLQNVRRQARPCDHFLLCPVHPIFTAFHHVRRKLHPQASFLINKYVPVKNRLFSLRRPASGN